MVGILVCDAPPGQTTPSTDLRTNSDGRTPTQMRTFSFIESLHDVISRSDTLCRAFQVSTFLVLMRPHSLRSRWRCRSAQRMETSCHEQRQNERMYSYAGCTSHEMPRREARRRNMPAPANQMQDDMIPTSWACRRASPERSSTKPSISPSNEHREPRNWDTSGLGTEISPDSRQYVC